MPQTLLVKSSNNTVLQELARELAVNAKFEPNSAYLICEANNSRWKICRLGYDLTRKVTNMLSSDRNYYRNLCRSWNRALNLSSLIEGVALLSYGPKREKKHGEQSRNRRKCCEAKVLPPLHGTRRVLLGSQKPVVYHYALHNLALQQ
jgi:hypothetical protein